MVVYLVNSLHQVDITYFEHLNKTSLCIRNSHSQGEKLLKANFVARMCLGTDICRRQFVYEKSSGFCFYEIIRTEGGEEEKKNLDDGLKRKERKYLQLCEEECGQDRKLVTHYFYLQRPLISSLLFITLINIPYQLKMQILSIFIHETV